MNIYQIQQELLDIFEQIEENEGDITPEIEEQLTISQQDFKNKIKSYSDVIKQLESDLAGIKEEKARLDNLKKSKEKTIERLKKIMIEAIELFGDTTKSGGKFVDYGTGKISIKTSDVVEVDEHTVDRGLSRFFLALRMYAYQNQMSQSIVDCGDIADYINTQADEEDVDFTNLNDDDFEFIKADINVNTNLKDLLQSPRAFELVKALVDYGVFEVKAKVSKTDIKNYAKEHKCLPSFARMDVNKTITIK